MSTPGFPRRGLHAEVVHHIGVQILRGDLQPGDLLPNEDQLSRELYVSRTVLREAIKVLTAKGLVQSKPRIGTWVRPRRYWNVLDPDVLAWRIEVGPEDLVLREIFTLRKLIESTAARLAADWASEDELAELAQAYREMEKAVQSPDGYIAADVRFHTAISRACHNELLEYMGEMLRGVYEASFALIHQLPGVLAATLPAHQAVVDAIMRRDGQAAEKAMLDLIDQSAALHDER
jgi:GntR family galactonate operon transcriptional repressor